jgi:large subunit ribosomal protein L15
MANVLSKLQGPVGANTPKTRIGRGVGSGLGKTAGRGQKGQYARSRGFKPHFEGGQTPLQRRLPKRGFNPPFRARVAEINVEELEIFSPGSNVDEQSLRDHGLLKGPCDSFKILGRGALTKPMTVTAHSFSKSAAEKILKAGGKAVVFGEGSASTSVA